MRPSGNAKLSEDCLTGTQFLQGAFSSFGDLRFGDLIQIPDRDELHDLG